MTPENQSTAVARALRIRDLERSADESRQRLQADFEGLATELRENVIVQAVTSGVTQGQKLANSFFNPVGGLMDLVRGSFFRSIKREVSRPKFPWKALLGAAVGAASLFRWWNARGRDRPE